MKITVQSLTRTDIILNIVNWIRNSNAQYGTPKTVAHGIENGEWLEWLNSKIENELNHHNS